MKKLTLLAVLLLLGLALVVSCGQKVEEADDTSAAGQPEEVMDTTRMDSATVDSTVDSLMDEAQEAAEEAVEEAVEGAGQ